MALLFVNPLTADLQSAILFLNFFLNLAEHSQYVEKFTGKYSSFSFSTTAKSVLWRLFQEEWLKNPINFLYSYFLQLFQPHCGNMFLLSVVQRSCTMLRAPHWQLCMIYFIFLFHQFTVCLAFPSVLVSLTVVCLVTDSAAVCFSISFEAWSKIHSVPPQSFT